MKAWASRETVERVHAARAWPYEIRVETGATLRTLGAVVGGLVELGVVTWIVVKAVRTARAFAKDRTHADFHARIRAAVQGGAGAGPLQRIVAAEISAVYYGASALLFWRPVRRASATGREFAPCQRKRCHGALFGDLRPLEFTIHRKGGYGLVVGTLVFVSFIEMGVVDALVRQASATAANVLLVVGAYAVLWVLGDLQAMRARPIVVDGDDLLVRVGRRREARIPLADVDAIEPVGAAGVPRGERDYVRCTALGPAEVVLRLRRPARFEQMLGRTRVASRVGLSLDDDAEFERCIRARIHPPKS